MARFEILQWLSGPEKFLELSRNEPQDQRKQSSQSEDTSNPMDQWKLETNTCSWRQARENACTRVTIGFNFTSNWLKKWREFFKPINQRGYVKPNQLQITFDTQVKTALNGLVIRTVTWGF